MFVKICGLTSVDETSFINEYKPDYVGMVLFFEKSKRNIDVAKAKDIMKELDPSIKKVAVTVSPDATQVMAICLAGFDVIQIHGQINEGVMDVLSIPMWKAFNVSDMPEYDLLAENDKITGFVFDAAEPGSGKGFDYDLLSSIRRIPGKLFILAGGLNAENIESAVEGVQPDLVDVSSSVEYKDRLGKDPKLVGEFVQAVRNLK